MRGRMYSCTKRARQASSASGGLSLQRSQAEGQELMDIQLAGHVGGVIAGIGGGVLRSIHYPLAHQEAAPEGIAVTIQERVVQVEEGEFDGRHGASGRSCL